MKTPSKKKVWQFNVNKACILSNATSTNQNVMLQIKNALSGFNQNPWIVHWSSDSSTTQAGDLWTDHTKVVNGSAANPKSWVILKQNGIRNNFQFMIACDGTTTNNRSVSMYVSPENGFTDNGTTIRPYASDEIMLLSASAWGGGAAAEPWYVHAMQTTDGACTRVLVLNEQSPGMVMFFEQASGSVSAWTENFVAYVGATSTAARLSNYASNARFKTLRATTAISLHCAAPMINGDLLVELDCGVNKNIISGSYHFIPITLFNISTPKGVFGSLYDLYFTSTNNLADGYKLLHTISTGNDVPWVRVDSLIFPWTGSLGGAIY